MPLLQDEALALRKRKIGHGLSILDTTEAGRSQIKLRAHDQTVWLTQLAMAELFDATKQNVPLPLKNIFEDGELDAGSVVKESLTTAADGKRYPTLL